MAQDRPSAENLLETVTAFLRDLMPKVKGAERFHTRVSIHLLEIVIRELRSGERYDAEEKARLEALLGREGSLSELNERLARAIREGEFDERREEAFAHVLRTVEDKLRIVNPAHLEQPTQKP
ncbi:MAG: hypothetical protein HKP27_09680 [Myxococcales bacterium]|nr:hypothetical protein [Myxococcales bacterium]